MDGVCLEESQRVPEVDRVSQFGLEAYAVWVMPLCQKGCLAGVG